MLRRLLLVLLLALSPLGLAGAPAHAASPAAAVSAANGTVGVAQTVAVVAPDAAGRQVTLLVLLGGVPTGQLTGNLDAQGEAVIRWVPTAAGTWTIRGLAGVPATATATVTVAPVATRTTVFTPTAVGLGLATTLTATVTPTGGAFMPQGTLTFASVYGPVLGTTTVTPGADGQAVGSVTWTPTALGPFPIVVRFTPTGGGSTASAAGSELYVTTSLPTLRLVMPSSIILGQSAPLTAFVADPLVPGTAAFLNSRNGVTTSMSPSTPVVSGRTTLQWTPSAPGNQFVTAQFTSTDGNVSGAFTQGIAVQLPWPADPLSVASAGIGTLTTAAPTTVPGGQRIGWATSTGSGAAVNLAESGPCLFDGAVLITPRAGGTCLVTATSTGGGTLGPNSATFTLTVTKA